MKSSVHRIFLQVKILQQWFLALMEDFKVSKEISYLLAYLIFRTNPRQGSYYISTCLCLPLPTPLLLFVYLLPPHPHPRIPQEKTLPNKAMREPVSQEELVFIPRLESVDIFFLHCAACRGVLSQGHQIPP